MTAASCEPGSKSCAKAVGVVLEHNESISATTHLPGFSLDLVPDKKPSKDPKPGGRLECCACRGPYLFYDKLRHVVLSKLDDDPSRLAEIVDLLVTIHRCERQSYRYMADINAGCPSRPQNEASHGRNGLEKKSFLPRVFVKVATVIMARRACCGGVLVFM